MVASGLEVGSSAQICPTKRSTQQSCHRKAMSLCYSFVMHMNSWVILGAVMLFQAYMRSIGIIKANTAVRHVISKCVFCRHNHGRPNEQKMADVPKNRISPAPPFTYTGVDYFGAFIIKEGRKEVKRYGALFTCLVSQAVHIKVASSLEPSSFIQALRHFITHRGPVKKQGVTMAQILSVHRTSCSKPLKKWTTKRCESKLQKQNINWIFNPPAASQMGGAWGCQIRSTRKVLAGLMEEYGHCLDEESFRTLMCEVEAIVNLRPLTTVSGRPGDLPRATQP